MMPINWTPSLLPHPHPSPPPSRGRGKESGPAVWSSPLSPPPLWGRVRVGGRAILRSNGFSSLEPHRCLRCKGRFRDVRLARPPTPTRPRRGGGGANDPRPSDRLGPHLDQRAVSIGQAIERIVVKDEDLPVSAHLDVAFDGEPARNRGLCCLTRVLDDPARGVVQAAVGDWTLGQPGRGVDRVQASISNTASTSASALSGRCATPTVVRA